MFGASQAAEESLEYARHVFQIVGSNPFRKPILGDMYYDTSLNQYMMYYIEGWLPVIYPERSTLQVSPIVINGKCTCCGAPDTGKMKCKYCQTTLRWYQ